MHTSTRLSATDFQFWHQSSRTSQQTDFGTFCPDYHALDRVAVVSPNLEDGVCQTGYALLALTTAFYDRLRTRSTDFFDYPQHFAFVGAQGTDVCTGNGRLPPDTPKLWHAWSWLDVWPDNKWITAPPTATAMLQRVFDHQINRLFWPRGLKPEQNEATLPDYAWKMLKTHLKAVYYYGDGAQQTGERFEIRASPATDALVQESLALLPASLPRIPPTRQCYEPVSVATFLAAMQP